MIQLCLDASNFVLPATGDGRQSGEDAVDQQLSDLKDLKSERPLRLIASLATYNVLSQENCIPNKEVVDLALKANGVHHLFAADVSKQLMTLLNNYVEWLEELTGVEVTVDGVSLNPEEAILESRTAFGDALREIAACVTLANAERKGADALPMVLVSRAVRETERAITVTARNLVVSRRNQAGEQEIEEIALVCGDLPVCRGRTGLRHALDPIRVWQAAESKDDLRLALDLWIAREYAGRAAALTYWFHPRFMQTLRVCGGLYPGRATKIVRELGQVIFNEALIGVHALREGAGPEEPQRTEGDNPKYLAWRRDVDRDSHLH